MAKTIESAILFCDGVSFNMLVTHARRVRHVGLAAGRAAGARENIIDGRLSGASGHWSVPLSSLTAGTERQRGPVDCLADSGRVENRSTCVYIARVENGMS